MTWNTHPCPVVRCFDCLEKGFDTRTNVITQMKDLFRQKDTAQHSRSADPVRPGIVVALSMSCHAFRRPLDEDAFCRYGFSCANAEIAFC